MLTYPSLSLSAVVVHRVQCGACFVIFGVIEWVWVSVYWYLRFIVQHKQTFHLPHSWDSWTYCTQLINPHTFQWDMIIDQVTVYSQPCRRSHSRGSTGASPCRCGGPRTEPAAEQSWRDASFRVSVWHPGSGSAVHQRSLWPCTSCQPGWESLDSWASPCGSCRVEAPEPPPSLTLKYLQRSKVRLIYLNNSFN